MRSVPDVWSQGKNPGQGTQPAPPVTKTKLEVKEFSGDFEQWKKTLQINSAEKVTFRWSTSELNTASAIWQVSDKPFSSGPQTTVAQAPHVIASGVLGQVPIPGHVSMFDINFAQFAPKSPPSTPLSYWVFIETKSSRQQPVGLPSAPVKIVYKKATQPPVEFSFFDPVDEAKRIVFVSNRDGNAEIYKMYSDGSSEVRLTNDPLDDRYPAWRPDHKEIAFAKAGEIFVMDFEGKNVKRLTNNSYVDSVPRWSPDGSKIAFSSSRGGNYDLYVMNADGSNEKRLTSDSAADDVPSWSPDGSKIAFQSRRNGWLQIYVMNSDGSNQKRLSFGSDSGITEKEPAWSSSGKIAFSREGGNIAAGFYVMNGDGSNIQELGGHGYHKDWGPNNRLVFAGYKNEKNIFVYDLNTNKIKQLTNFGPNIVNVEPNW
jgi:Tol biopolymer transport system component